MESPIDVVRLETELIPKPSTGGSIPFVIDVGIGSAGALWKEYNHSWRLALVAVENYPSLMLLHLASNFPLYMWRRRALRDGLRGKEFGWKERSMLVTAWQSAGAAVEGCVLCSVGVTGSVLMVYSG